MVAMYKKYRDLAEGEGDKIFNMIGESEDSFT